MLEPLSVCLGSLLLSFTLLLLLPEEGMLVGSTDTEERKQNQTSFSAASIGHAKIHTCDFFTKWNQQAIATASYIDGGRDQK